MQHSSNTKTGNPLLDVISSENLERLPPYLELVALLLAEPVPAAEPVCFPVAGLISVVATMADGGAVEIGMSDREGIFSIFAILSEGVPSRWSWPPRAPEGCVS